MTKLGELEQAITEVYQTVLSMGERVQPDAPEEVQWRAAAAHVKLPAEVREVLMWYLTHNVDGREYAKALRLLHDTARDPTGIDVVATVRPDDQGVAEQIETTFFVDMRGSVWLYAVRNADGGELTELAELLLTEEITAEGAALVADLLNRHQPIGFHVPHTWTMDDQRRLATKLGARSKRAVELGLPKAGTGLKKKKGRQMQPIYEMSEIHNRLEIGVAAYHAALRHYPKGKVARMTLIEMLAEHHGVEFEDLRRAVDRERSDLERAQEKRRNAFKIGKH